MAFGLTRPDVSDTSTVLMYCTVLYVGAGSKIEDRGALWRTVSGTAAASVRCAIRKKTGRRSFTVCEVHVQVFAPHAIPSHGVWSLPACHPSV